MKGRILTSQGQLLIGLPVIFFLVLLILYIVSGRCGSICHDYVQATKAAIYTSHVKL
jgi:hypothetical protein